MDLMCMALRLAGFELRDSIGYAHDGGGAPLLAWCYGSGFPKSHDISKAIDREAGADREVVGPKIRLGDKKTYAHNDQNDKGWGKHGGTEWRDPITAPATPAAQQWEGWGSALKPSFEPVILARKPLQGTLAQNVQEHGTGGLNIDGCRVGNGEAWSRPGGLFAGKKSGIMGETVPRGPSASNPAGRWPANLLHSGEPEVVACFPETVKQGSRKLKDCPSDTFGGGSKDSAFYGDSGTAARFFKTCPDDDPEDAETRRLVYMGKATKRDRDEGLEGFEEVFEIGTTGRGLGNTLPSCPVHGAGLPSGQNEYACGCAPVFDKSQSVRKISRANTHPCVKPTPLMQYLCRLITPPGGIILDPFTGSGSTGKAAVLEGFQFIGIEMEPEYVAIANARIAAAAACSEKASLEQRLAWLETQVQAQGAKLKRIEATQQLSLWEVRG
jgi:site-specific DNA-methyltransferase (adenine-specific)